MTAIFKREFKAYFTAPLGFVVLAITLCFSGYMFYSVNLYNKSSTLDGVFNSLYLIFVVLMPILTMRSFSDEKRLKTDQLLLTAPVKLPGIVMGKYFAAVVVMVLASAVTIIYGVVIAFMVTPDWTVIVGNFIGLLLIGGLFITIGIFVSSMTESQLVSALVSIIVCILLLLLDQVVSIFHAGTLIVSVVQFLSLNTRYSNFCSGVINYSDIVFFLSLQALFLFLTVRVLDKKRWS